MKSRNNIGIAWGRDAVVGCIVDRRGNLVGSDRVELTEGVVISGEVHDDEALVWALRLLKKNMKIANRRVNLAIGGTRVVVRPIAMPPMPLSELRSAVRLQAGEHLPAGIGDATVDIQQMPRVTDQSSELSVLIAAAPNDLIGRTAKVCSNARIRINSIDVAPLAVARAIADNDGSTEAVIAMGEEITEVGVTMSGSTFFARTVPVGVGKNVWKDLDPSTTADLLFPMLEEVRTTLAYATSQVRHTRLDRIILSAPPQAYHLVASCLTATMQVPVVSLESRLHLAADNQVAQIDTLAAAFGAARGALAEPGWAVSLVLEEVAQRSAQRRQIAIASVAVGAVGVVLAGASVVRGHVIDDAKAELATAQRQQIVATRQVADLKPVADRLTSAANASKQAAGALSGDVDWPKFISDVSQSMPSDVWLTSFSAATNEGKPTFSVDVNSNNPEAASAWLRSVGVMPQVSAMWIPSVSHADPVSTAGAASSTTSAAPAGTSPTGVGSTLFSVSGQVTPVAHSERGKLYGGAS